MTRQQQTTRKSAGEKYEVEPDIAVADLMMPEQGRLFDWDVEEVSGAEPG